MTRAPYTVGVDLGGTNMVIGVVDASGRVKARSKIPTLAAEGPGRTLKRMSAEILKVAADSGLSKSSIKAVGVGCPGPLSAPKGVVIGPPNLTGWKQVPLVKVVSRQTGMRVFLENDANCAALGEAAHGAGRGFENVVVLTLGTGIGGGLILNGQLYSGPDTMGGELGHFAVDKNGPLCGCGQVGCLEQYASATAIARRARQLLSKARKGPLWRLCGGELGSISAQMVHAALQLKDPVAKIVWDEAGWALGTAVTGYINIFNPDRVILFGGVMSGGKELLAASRHRAPQGAFRQPARRAKIVRAQLGDDAGLVGAAEVAQRSLAAGHAV
jgi:glucokinase